MSSDQSDVAQEASPNERNGHVTAPVHFTPAMFLAPNKSACSCSSASAHTCQSFSCHTGCARVCRVHNQKMGLYSLHTAHRVDWWSHLGRGALLPTSTGLDHETKPFGSSSVGPGQGTFKLTGNRSCVIYGCSTVATCLTDETVIPRRLLCCLCTMQLPLLSLLCLLQAVCQAVHME